MSKYIIKYTNQFKKDYKLLKRRHKNINLLMEVIHKLSNGEKLNDSYRDHSLSNNWKGFRECHIEPDWLLIYKLDENVLVLTLTRSGTHSDLF